MLFTSLQYSSYLEEGLIAAICFVQTFTELRSHCLRLESKFPKLSSFFSFPFIRSFWKMCTAGCSLLAKKRNTDEPIDWFCSPALLQTSTNAKANITGAACTSASTSQGTTGAPATTGSVWHTTATTAWVSGCGGGGGGGDIGRPEPPEHGPVRACGLFWERSSRTFCRRKYPGNINTLKSWEI